MKIIVLFFVILQLVSGQCNPSSPSVRQEWRQLSEGQKRAYLAAVQALKSRSFSGDNTADPATWNHDMFTKVHWQYQQAIHNLPAFLPWHRKFIRGYEQALQSIDSTIALPYWDWRIDSQNPAGSELFLGKNFGGNGDAKKDNCVTDGVVANWTSAEGPNSGKCLKRCNAWGVIHSPQSVAKLIEGGSDFDSFYTAIQGGPHASVHNQMGGGCGDMASHASPNDPIFYLHHSMVDKLWWVWQKSCSDYFEEGPGNADYPPFGKVNTFSSTENGFCYSYTQSAGDAAYTLTCPSGQTNPWGGAVTTTTSATTGGPTSTPLSKAANTWLQSAISALIPVPAIANVAQKNIEFHLRKRDFTYVGGGTTSVDDYCHWWGNIKCATWVSDEYLRTMHDFSEEQIAYINKMKPIACAGVKAINADPTQNSTASLMYFQKHNPHWIPPKQC